MNTPSRQLTTLTEIDRPEPPRSECTTPELKMHKALCILIDALARTQRGHGLEDWETHTCVKEARGLLDEILSDPT